MKDRSLYHASLFLVENSTQKQILSSEEVLSLTSLIPNNFTGEWLPQTTVFRKTLNRLSFSRHLMSSYPVLTWWSPNPSFEWNHNHGYIIMVLAAVALRNVQQLVKVHTCQDKTNVNFLAWKMKCDNATQGTILSISLSKYIPIHFTNCWLIEKFHMLPPYRSL